MISTVGRPRAVRQSPAQTWRCTPLAHDTRGAQLVEYVIVVGAVALIGAVGFRAFGSKVEAKVEAQAEQVQTFAGADGAPVSAADAPTGTLGHLSSAQGAATTGGQAQPSKLARFASFFTLAAHAATVEAPLAAAPPPPPAPAAATPAAAPPALVTENADTAFADFHGAGQRKKGIGFWVTKDAGNAVAFGFTAGAAIDSDAATNVVKTRAAFVEGVHDYVDPDYQGGTTTKFIHVVPVLDKKGQPVLGDDGKPTTKQVRKPIPANEIPYIALPPRIYMPRDKNGNHIPGTGPLGGVQVRPGDYVRVSYNGNTVYAIFADGGPQNEVGEVSMYVAEALGLSANPRAGGIDTQEVTYEILPGSGPAIPVEGEPGKLQEVLQPMTPSQIQANGKKAFDDAAKKKWVVTKP